MNAFARVSTIERMSPPSTSTAAPTARIIARNSGQSSNAITTRAIPALLCQCGDVRQPLNADLRIAFQLSRNLLQICRNSVALAYRYEQAFATPAWHVVTGCPRLSQSRPLITTAPKTGLSQIQRTPKRPEIGALVWGTRGRLFKSAHPDHLNLELTVYRGPWVSNLHEVAK